MQRPEDASNSCFQVFEKGIEDQENMLTSYAGHDHHGYRERQRRFDSGSLWSPSGTGPEGYMATSR